MNTRSRIALFMMALVLLISTLSISVVNAVSTGQSASTITLNLSDSYGDGWNGNKIAVYIDGVISSNYTVSSGFSNSYSILYDSAKTYEFKWIKGNYATECSFEITLDSAVLLSSTKTQCGNYTNGQSLLILDRADYDLNGEFAGGLGTVAEPYLVATKEQLNNVRKYPAAHFRQVRNIAFTAGDFAASGDYYNNGNGWEPLGNYDYPFYGYYDGNGFTISGLTIKGISTPYAHIGLFGYATGDIVNVNLTDIAYTITGNATVGGIVGYSFNSEIIGCSASGVIIAGGGSIGGIAGDVYTVKYCVSDVTIEAGGENQHVDAGGIASYAYKIVGCENRGDISVAGDYLEVGGIVGEAWTGISNCKNSGSITADGESDAEVKIGGIVGYGSCDIAKCENSGWVTGSGEYVEIGGIAGRSCGSLSATTVSECVNKGNILTVAPIYSSSVGGIVGEALEGTIRDCYTTDTVQLSARGTYQAVAGGIAGYVWDDSTITNCYSLVNTVSVNTGASNWGRGGIAGHNYGTVSQCYYRYTYGVGYNKGSSSITCVPTLSKYATQSTYSGFDFTSVWKMGSGTYTYAALRMESGHTHSLAYNAATVTYESAGNLENWYCSACQTYFRNSAGTLYVTTDMLKSDPIPRTGTCGNGIAWRLTYEGVLTISGKGEMENYTTANPAPWYACREKVKAVIVMPGVTSIGSNAFNGCVNLTRVSLEAEIRVIGDGAFAGCSSLTQLRIPEAVTSVGEEAFAFITNLIVCFDGGAPAFGGTNVFSNTAAKAYYPNDDTTWTSNVMQSQIGSVTWMPYGSIDDVIVASGSLNYEVSWTLSIAGKLTVTGRYSSTKMPDYYYSTRPSWEVYKEHITSVDLVNIERIGNQAFYEYPALKSVNFGTVTAIGASAFYNCTALENVFLEIYWGECTIGSQAFYNCTSLRQVAFPCRTTIGSYAFYRCTQLSEIYIADYGELWLDNDYGLKPASNSFDGVTATVYIPVNGWHVTDYGDFGGSLTWKAADFGPCGTDAFWTYDEATSTLIITGTGSVASYSAGHDYPWYGLCSNIKNVVFEDGITYIPRYVLEFMYYVQEVTLPKTLQIMACNAFNDCKSLNNLIIPASVTAFDSGSSFNRCDALTDVYYMGTAEEWAKVGNNYLVSNYIKNLHFLVLTESTATCITSGVEAYYRFDDTSVYSGYYNLDKQPITQPQVIPAPGHNYEDGVCTRCGGVDPAAFIDQGACGDNLTWKLDKQGVLTIFGTGAMWDYSIEYISGIGSVTTAPWGEYYDSLKSLKLSDGITTIGQYAFYECSGFTGSLTIPNSVTTIRDNAFAYCSGFTGSLTIPSSVTTIGERAFYLCRGFNGNLTIPGSVTTISPYAFYWCSGLTGALIIGEGVTTIGEYAFNSCNGFTGNLNLPVSVTAIGNFAFSGCYGFTGSLIIPNSVTVIGSDAFSNCSGFDGSLGIPSSVTTIGMGAFRGCIGFTGSLTIPSSVTAINDQAFMNCIGFTGTLTIPSSIQTIGYGAFWGCKGLSGSLIIPDSVATIGGYAFRDCSGITDVVIPAGVTAVGNYSFCNCSALAKATIYTKTATFEDHVFQNAPTTFTIYGYAGSTAEAYAKNNSIPFVTLRSVTASGPCGDNLTWTLYEDGELVVEGTGEMWNYGQEYNSELAVYMTSAPWAAYATKLSALTLTEGITSIGNDAFYLCNNLTGSLTIPESVQKIGSRAFGSCNFTGELIIPDSVEIIGQGAFDSCGGFTGNLTLGNSVITIGQSAFSYCSGFTGGLTIPDSVTAIGKYAFSSCAGFSGSLIIGNGVKEIGEKAFLACGFTGEVVVAESVVSLGDYAFAQCKISAVQLPQGLESVGNLAFAGCDSLSKVTIYAKDTHFGANTFSEVNPNLTIYGYTGSTAEAYATANNHRFVALTGVSLSGQIKVEGNITSPTTVKLMQNGTVVSQTEITGNTYSFTGVSVGTYDLVIERVNHLPYTITGIPVGIEDVDLRTHLNASISHAVLPAGDINGDNCIDLQDLILLTSADTFNKPYADAAVKAADVNGDQLIDLKDLIIVTSEQNFNKSPVIVSFSPEA